MGRKTCLESKDGAGKASCGRDVRTETPSDSQERRAMRGPEPEPGPEGEAGTLRPAGRLRTCVVQ